jgi:hypothetical protein
MSRATPWAVLLCKFKDDQRGFITINRQDVEAMFTSNDIENIPTFWRDVSYGEIDMSGSKVFGWLTLDQKQEDYRRGGTNDQIRSAIVALAKQTASDAGIDLASFYGVTLYMSTETDLWGSPGTVMCDVGSSLAQILQEYGHGYGLKHSRSLAVPEDYKNPFCIMSGMDFGNTEPTFTDRFGASGPLLCSPYVEAAEWFSPSQIAHLETNGTRPTLNTLRLSPLGGATRPYPQAAVFGLNVPYETTYFIEFRSGGWDRGMAQNQVVIHQRRPDGYAYFAGSIPTSVGLVNGVTLLPGRSWLDTEFDLSVRLHTVLDQDDAIEITVGPAAAVQALSVRTIAQSKLNVTGRFSVQSQIARSNEKSLRASLLALVGH